MGWYLDSPLFQQIIEFHEFNIANNLTQEGHNLQGTEVTVNPEIKDSKDSLLNWNADMCLEYMQNILRPCADEYMKKYPQAANANLGVSEPTTIQKYFPPTGGFPAWHHEKPGVVSALQNRHLVFMTYLNDVSDGGETEFFFQNVKIKPEKGLTLMFPTEWTHTHRGNRSATQEKTIVTGWMSKIEPITP